MKTKKIMITLIFMLLISLFNTFLVISYKTSEHIVSSLSGYCIFIDPGHGGKDNGTSFNDVLEDEINLAIAKKVYERLLDDNARVIISRIADYDLSDMYAKNHKIQDLNKRIEYMKKCNVDLFISIHLNSYSSSDVSGAQVFYKSNLNESKTLANCIQDSLNSLNKKNKKVKTGDYYIFKNTGQINGIIVECGFLSNSEDRQNLLSDSYQNKIAKLIHEGLINYLELKNRI